MNGKDKKKAYQRKSREEGMREREREGQRGEREGKLERVCVKEGYIERVCVCPCVFTVWNNRILLKKV